MSNRKVEEMLKLVQEGKIPVHVAIIMDGNGRWAEKRGLPRIAGHEAGMETLREIIGCADEIGIKILTFYAFSTENWKRPSKEVRFLMRLPGKYLRKELNTLMNKNIVITSIGDFAPLPEQTINAITKAMQLTSNNTGLIVNLALNYGGRAEIVEAVKQIALKVANGTLSPDAINEEVLAAHLYTRNIPDPDLLIRPSGELRISNFLLWQMAYTELWFTEIQWPDFNKELFLRAILDFQSRDRRFGGVRNRNTI